MLIVLLLVSLPLTLGFEGGACYRHSCVSGFCADSYFAGSIVAGLGDSSRV